MRGEQDIWPHGTNEAKVGSHHGRGKVLSWLRLKLRLETTYPGSLSVHVGGPI